MSLSLEEFAPRNPSQCVACAVPAELRTEFERARHADPKRFTYSTISRWLASKGSTVSEDSLRRHFGRGHA